MTDPKVKIEDEYWHIANEISNEATLEIFVELARRNVSHSVAAMFASISLLTEAVVIMKKLHDEHGGAPSMSKETLHNRIDEMWETLSGPENEDPTH